jgi:CBS domain-containing protein
VGVLVTPGSFPVARFVVGWLAIANVSLTIFNLLPAFPMDGGRILRALLARSRPYGTATRLAARIGVVFAFLFAAVGVLTFQLLLLLLALFIYGAATTESRTVLLDELLEGITVGDIMTRDPASVSAETSIDSLGEQMLRDRQTVHLVTGADGSVVGIVSLDDLRKARRADRATTRVEDIMETVPRVDASADAFDTLAMLNQGGGSDALVHEGDTLVGVLTQSDVARAMTIRRGFQSAAGG